MNDKRIKLIKIILSVITVLLIAIGTVHTTIAFVNSVKSQPYTSFPATTALLLIIPYALAVAACAFGLLIVCKKSRK